MSNARPMTDERRRKVYGRSALFWTDRQRRQWGRMRARNANCLSGASGLPVRRPIPRNSKPPQRGSWATHVMVAPEMLGQPWKRMPR